MGCYLPSGSDQQPPGSYEEQGARTTEGVGVSANDPRLLATRMALRPAEAAKELGVSVRTIHRWLRDGSLRSVGKQGTRLIPVSAVLCLLGEAPVHEERETPESEENRWATNVLDEVLGEA